MDAPDSIHGRTVEEKTATTPLPKQVPITQSQLMIWLGQKLNPEAPLYNMALAFHLTHDVDTALFRTAFDQLTVEAPVLTAFLEEREGIPMLCYDPRSKLHLDLVDLSANTAQAVNDYLLDRAKRRFQIDTCMADSALVMTSSGPVWFLNQHHLITDIWSCSLLYRRMAEIYGSLQTLNNHQQLTLTDFREYVIQEVAAQRSAEYRSALAYWQARSGEGAARAKTVPANGNAATLSERITVSMGETRSSALLELSRTPGVRGLSLQLTELNLFLTALFAYLYRIERRRQPVVGLIFHNRDTPALRTTVGPLIETCAVSVEMQGGESFTSLYEKTSKETIATLRHLRPGISRQASKRDFDIVLNFITAEFPDFLGTPTRAEWIHSGHADTNHKLRLQVHRLNESETFTLSFDLNEQQYNRTEGKRAIDHFLTVQDRMLEDFNGSIDAFDLLSPAERHRYLVSFNQTQNKANAELTAVELFEAQVEETPRAEAVKCRERALTYAELNNRANHLAHHLIRKGIGTEDLVGIEADRSIETLITVVGVIKSGAAYVPLDPSLPAGRLQQYIEDIRSYHPEISPLVLSHTHAAANLFTGLGAEVVDTADLITKADGPPSQNPPVRAGADNPVYVLFTSGSTGRPKGVMVEHRNLANYLSWARAEYTGFEHLSFALFTSLSFDLTITSLFVPLISGHAVIVYPDHGERSDLTLLDVLREDKVDVIKVTPSHLELMLAGSHRPARLKQIIVGGEEFSTQLARRVHASLGGRAEIFNEYGPTEATVGSMIHLFNDKQDVADSVPIGVPIFNTQVYVLDPCCNPVPTNTVGEICIGGAGVARGYLNSPELTAKRFVENPFVQGGRIYRTGDLAKWDERGRIRLLGRADRQIKVRGFRIELGEIESIIAENPRIQGCVVESISKGPEDDTTPAFVYCTKCGLPSNYPNVDYDDAGICSVCREFSHKHSLFKSYFGSSEDLKHLANKIISARQTDYDCIALFSGGKDSTFMLCKLVEFGIRPLAFTLDNGFISDSAKENIARVVTHLKVDHIFGHTRHMNDIFADSLDRHSNVCNGCFKTIYTLSMQVARSKGIKYIVTGLSRGQLFETRLADILEEDISDVRQIDRYVAQARKAYHRMDDAVARCLDVEVFGTDAIFDEVEFIDFFRYCDASLTDIYTFLASRVPWIRPQDTGRSTNCLINDVGIYVHKIERGYHNYALPYSWDVRLGHKQRNAALEELDDEIDDVRVEEILNKLGYQIKEPARQPGSRIVAFCSAETIAREEIADYVEQRLPYYMRPDQYVVMKTFPLSPHGKVDRQLLRDQILDADRDESVVDEAETPVESRLRAMWQELLGTGNVARHENFFDLGGDSLLIVRLITQINREFGVSIELSDFFKSPTIGQLGRVIDDLLLQEIMNLDETRTHG